MVLVLAPSCLLGLAPLCSVPVSLALVPNIWTVFAPMRARSDLRALSTQKLLAQLVGQLRVATRLARLLATMLALLAFPPAPFLKQGGLAAARIARDAGHHLAKLGRVDEVGEGRVNV